MSLRKPGRLVVRTCQHGGSDETAQDLVDRGRSGGGCRGWFQRRGIQPGSQAPERADGDGRSRGPAGQGHRQRQGPGAEEGRDLGHHLRPGHPARGATRATWSRRASSCSRSTPSTRGRRPAVSEFSMQALLRDLDSARATPRPGAGRLDARRGRTTRPGSSRTPTCSGRRTAVATAEAALLAAERRVEQAGATLEGARDTLAKTTVRSPIDGIVTARRVEEGEVAVIGIQNQPGHRAPDHLRHVGGRGRDGGRRDLDPRRWPSARRRACASTPTRTRPSTASVTEVGSLADPADHQPDRGDQVQGQGPASRTRRRASSPGLSVQADILTGFRRPGADRADPGAGAARDRAQARRAAARTGAPRDEEGVYVVEKRQGRASSRSRPACSASCRSRCMDGLKGGETIITGPFRALRSLKAGDAVREEKAKPRARATPPARADDEPRASCRARRSASLRTHKLRSFLTLLGIIIGVTTLVGRRLGDLRAQRLRPGAGHPALARRLRRHRSSASSAAARSSSTRSSGPTSTFATTSCSPTALTKAEAVAADAGTQAAVKRRGRHLADMQVHGTTAELRRRCSTSTSRPAATSPRPRTQSGAARWR